MALPPKRQADPARQRLRADLIAFGFVGLLLWGINFLPPDTTLAQVRESGALRVCVPDAYPPLVTGDPDRPGIDIELLREVADGLGVRLVTVTNSAIGRDFNPRNWRVTRAQCLVIAGGIVDADATRSFLVVTRPHLETGWAAVVVDQAQATFSGAKVGFFAGLTGLDRLGLSRWLRDRGANVTVLSSVEDAASGLADGRFDVVVTEALTARQLATKIDSVAAWLPLEDGRLPIAFGLWKGDLTLERALERQLARLERDGTLHEIIDRYDLGPIDATCPLCN